MKVIRSAHLLRAALHGGHHAHPTIALVPTMGAYHEGHLALLRAAKRDHPQVVVSLFVNPTQFNDPEDLARYPRDLAGDMDKAAAAGCDILFVPVVEEIYPPGFATRVEVGRIAEPFEGAHRPGHFTGVATVVAKLFNIVSPDAAYFGMKDYQQTLVVRRLVADLNLGVEIVALPTVREPDGLAMSSRNQRLIPASRSRASALYRTLCACRDHLQTLAPGEPVAAALAAGRAALAAAGLTVDYFAAAHPDTLETVATADGPRVLLAAVDCDGVRLIDNVAVACRRAGAG
ncbi:MAG: pantoate--beta-alanine ligase [Nitrospirae bacterium CG18_big_fil_WC_8_21_14_2_50_70_55]|nr:pantoate--beta-alanine ligase [Deltaproteobacteria bacterium]NCS74488.1 pantoate--beta-alanine ligase [Deltaproteobacteria bacterium]OIP64035.1 MAG: pantoate--beta-alanine ligase [Nitrospirae bacterium CG2_30_70_394]PIQ05367.1 MAG: pantoate--beta-alanine ligase [Nitrospirae bacterium CG18_big_fil_WC_8_21_14_2_50_70_55]HBB41278.1 pantoate--beta-alanine ligase [Pseudomonadota bacterium]